MSASVLIRRSVFARTGVAAVRAPAAQFRGYATRKPHADEPEAANAAEKVGKALKSDGSIGSKFNADGSVGSKFQEVGGPFSADGAIGKQFTDQGAIGGTGQKVAESVEESAKDAKK